VQLAALILLCVIAGGWLIGSLLHRFGVAWGGFISFFAQLLGQLTAAFYLAWTAVEVAERGGAWYGLAAALAVLALGLCGLVALLVWAVLKYGIDLED
jgi:hypothetical protein